MTLCLCLCLLKIPPPSTRLSGVGGGVKMVRESKKEAVTREYTINLHKRLHGITFKKRAPRAIRDIKKFASKTMGTPDVRLDVKLNKAVWAKGIRNVPYRYDMTLITIIIMMMMMMTMPAPSCKAEE